MFYSSETVDTLLQLMHLRYQMINLQRQVPTKLKKQKFKGTKLPCFGYVVKLMLLSGSTRKSELSRKKSTEPPSLRKCT